MANSFKERWLPIQLIIPIHFIETSSTNPLQLVKQIYFMATFANKPFDFYFILLLHLQNNFTFANCREGLLDYMTAGNPDPKLMSNDKHVTVN